MLCRVCLLEASEILAIFEDLGEQFRIAELIKQHLLFKPDANDNITTHICVVCWDMIKDFHKFYKNVEKAQKQYEEIVRKMVNTKSLEAIEVKEELERPNCSSRIKEENNIDDAFDEKIMQMDIESQENTLVGHKANTEQHNPLEYLNEESEFDCDDTSGQDEDDYEPSDISEPLESQNDEPELRASEKKLKGFRKKRKSLEDCSESEKITKKKAKKDKEKKQRIYINKTDPAVTDTLIEKHIPMGCQLCVFVGKQFADIVEHFRKSHPKTRPFITCCDKRFTKRFYVAQHALKHEDPNCFRCDACKKIFTTTCGLRAHNMSYHPKEEECIYVCDQCPKKFSKSNLLDWHKVSHIPKEEWSYFCTICPEKKAFASDHLLQSHTITQHRNPANICHVCAKVIKDKKSFEKHVQSHFNLGGPRIKCPYDDCESWLKDEDNLKKHLRRHNPEGIVYKCPDCEKVCKNLSALRNHKNYSHSNKIFTCDHCMKTFKRAITLREHMAQHTGETLYKCPFCTRTFNSNANMHAHKKRDHPIEWDSWRRSKQGTSQAILSNADT